MDVIELLPGVADGLLVGVLRLGESGFGKRALLDCVYFGSGIFQRGLASAVGVHLRFQSVRHRLCVAVLLVDVGNSAVIVGLRLAFDGVYQDGLLGEHCGILIHVQDLRVAVPVLLLLRLVQSVPHALRCLGAHKCSTGSRVAVEILQEDAVLRDGPGAHAGTKQTSEEAHARLLKPILRAPLGALAPGVSMPHLEERLSHVTHGFLRKLTEAGRDQVGYAGFRHDARVLERRAAFHNHLAERVGAERLAPELVKVQALKDAFEGARDEAVAGRLCRRRAHRLRLCEVPGGRAHDERR